jgi:hypothetical protein
MAKYRVKSKPNLQKKVSFHKNNKKNKINKSKKNRNQRGCVKQLRGVQKAIRSWGCME